LVGTADKSCKHPNSKKPLVEANSTVKNEGKLHEIIHDDMGLGNDDVFWNEPAILPMHDDYSHHDSARGCLDADFMSLFDAKNAADAIVTPCIYVPSPRKVNWHSSFHKLPFSSVVIKGEELEMLVAKLESASKHRYQDVCACGNVNNDIFDDAALIDDDFINSPPANEFNEPLVALHDTSCFSKLTPAKPISADDKGAKAASDLDAGFIFDETSFLDDWSGETDEALIQDISRVDATLQIKSEKDVVGDKAKTEQPFSRSSTSSSSRSLLPKLFIPPRSNANTDLHANTCVGTINTTEHKIGLEGGNFEKPLNQKKRFVFKPTESNTSIFKSAPYQSSERTAVQNEQKVQMAHKAPISVIKLDGSDSSTTEEEETPVKSEEKVEAESQIKNTQSANYIDRDLFKDDILLFDDDEDKEFEELISNSERFSKGLTESTEYCASVIKEAEKHAPIAAEIIIPEQKEPKKPVVPEVVDLVNSPEVFEIPSDDDFPLSPDLSQFRMENRLKKAYETNDLEVINSYAHMNDPDNHSAEILNQYIDEMRKKNAEDRAKKCVSESPSIFSSPHSSNNSRGSSLPVLSTDKQKPMVSTIPPKQPFPAVQTQKVSPSVVFSSLKVEVDDKKAAVAEVDKPIIASIFPCKKDKTQCTGEKKKFKFKKKQTSSCCDYDDFQLTRKPMSLETTKEALSDNNLISNKSVLKRSTTSPSQHSPASKQLISSEIGEKIFSPQPKRVSFAHWIDANRNKNKSNSTQEKRIFPLGTVIPSPSFAQESTPAMRKDDWDINISRSNDVAKVQSNSSSSFTDSKSKVDSFTGTDIGNAPLRISPNNTAKSFDTSSEFKKSTWLNTSCSMKNSPKKRSKKQPVKAAPSADGWMAPLICVPKEFQERQKTKLSRSKRMKNSTPVKTPVTEKENSDSKTTTKNIWVPFEDDGDLIDLSFANDNEDLIVPKSTVTTPTIEKKVIEKIMDKPLPKIIIPNDKESMKKLYDNLRQISIANCQSNPRSSACQLDDISSSTFLYPENRLKKSQPLPFNLSDDDDFLSPFNEAPRVFKSPRNRSSSPGSIRRRQQLPVVRPGRREPEENKIIKNQADTKTVAKRKIEEYSPDIVELTEVKKRKAKKQEKNPFIDNEAEVDEEDCSSDEHYNSDELEAMDANDSFVAVEDGDNMISDT